MEGTAAGTGIGASLRRVEDARFLTGTARYVDDIVLPNTAFAAVLRSPHAHARIAGIDTSKATNAPGVLLVLTGEDVKKAGIGGLPCRSFPPHSARQPTGALPTHPILAIGKVRHVGDRVALVVAETAAQAKDAAELVEVAYEPLPAVAMAAAALRAGTPKVWDEQPDNLCFEISQGDKDAVDRAFASAAHVTKMEFHYPRASANAIEPRSSLGVYDRFKKRYTLYTEAQAPHRVREILAADVLRVPETDLRVVSPDIGGGFGMKGATYPEEALVVWAAGMLDRPVKWTADRSESLMSDIHGRDQSDTAELALDKDGRMLALRTSVAINIGAYLAYSAGVPGMITLHSWTSVYDLPLVHATVRGAYTHTNPIGPYRGSGRPECTFLMERIADKAAREMGIDPVALKRKNLIPPSRMPYTTPGGQTYDCGDFESILDKTLALADVAGFAARRAESEKRGLTRGLGVSVHVESSGLYNERMEIRVDAGGSVAVHAGTLATGQGHETMYAQMASDFLGVAPERIRVFQGDTDRVLFGRGTFAERSALGGGSALRFAADAVIAKGKKLAAIMLEAADQDIEFAGGMFRVAGTDRAVPFGAVARFAHAPMGLPIELGIGLDGAGTFDGEIAFPNGAMVSEVEVDPATGAIRIDRFTCVDDCGVIVNPLMLDGQVHGSIAQGIGQVLTEEVLFDPDSGQLVTGSFMDYGMPRADDMPSFGCDFVVLPTRNNPLGVKGGAEPGNIAAPPCVVNAIVDALAPLGVTDIPMPATPERVWRAIQNKNPLPP
jgi:carbon-monoxide dehydrogenase large subunit